MSNRFRAEDQLSALLVENRLTNDRNLCQLFDEQVKRTHKSGLEQCTSLFEFSNFFIELNSYRVWHSRLGSSERPTGVCFSHRATATPIVNVDFHSIGLSTVSLNYPLSVSSSLLSKYSRHNFRENEACLPSPKEDLVFLHLQWTKGEIVQRRSRSLFV
jgi:hypothetical protein